MTMINTQTVCVTGAAGFLGSKLCGELLSRGSSVIAIDNFEIGKRSSLSEIESNIEIVKADIRDKESLKDSIKKSDTIFHLAAIDDRKLCQQNYELAVDINIKGTANVLSLCNSMQRFIYMSSNMVYGEARYLPIDELHPLDGYEPYSTTKISSEYLCRGYDFINEVPYTIVRNFNTFGPGQNKSSLIPTLIIEGLTKKKIEVWTADTVRDFQYIDNCIDNLIKIAESESLVGEVVNLGNGYGTTIGEITNKICELLGTINVYIKKPKPVSHKTISNVTKLKTMIDWDPKVSLEEGIKRTIEYYREELKKG